MRFTLKRVYVTETKPPKKGNHILHKLLPREACERQSTSQRGMGGTSAASALSCSSIGAR